MIASKKTVAKVVGTAGILAIAASTLGGTAAFANPVPVTPQRTYAAVGSDTIQDVYNAITNDTAAGYNNIASWNAFPAQDITPKAGGVTFLAPQGSGDGVKALSATFNPQKDTYTNSAGTIIDLKNVEDPATVALEDDGVNEVDIARSSSRPAATAQVAAGSTNDKLTYYAFARDAVATAVQNTGSSVAITNLTTAELKFLFDAGSTGTLVDSTGTFTAGSGTTDPTLTVGSAAPQSIHPILPQSSSGTRSFFLGAIGVTNIGGWVAQGVAENDGTVLTTAGDLVPFSAAQWIAQKNGVVTNLTSTATLTKINGKSATSGTTTLSPNQDLFGAPDAEPALGAGTFARDTYSVVDTANASAALKDEARTIGSATDASGEYYVEDYGFEALQYDGVGVYHIAYTN